MNSKVIKLVDSKEFKEFLEKAIDLMKEDEKNLKFGKKLSRALKENKMGSKSKFSYKTLEALDATVDDIEFIRIYIAKQMEFPMGVSNASHFALKNHKGCEFELVDETDVRDEYSVWYDQLNVRDLIPCFEKELLDEMIEKGTLFIIDDSEEGELVPIGELLKDNRKIAIGEDYDT